MGFLSPAFLLALTAVGVPLWLHLARRRKLVPVPFSSLRYLKQASARMRRQARLEDLGLLALRCLLVALLAMALARPVIRSRTTWLGLEWPRAVVVVIDATSSMNWHGKGGSRLIQAKHQAANWIRSLSANDRVALWVLSDHVSKPVPEPVSDHRLVLKALEEIEGSDGSSSLAPVFAAARDWADRESRGSRGLVVFTDNQPAAWDWPASTYFSQNWPKRDVDLLVVQTDAERPANLAVSPVRWTGNLARGGRPITGTVRVENKSSQPGGEIVELLLGNQTILRRTVELPAEGSVEIPLTVPPPANPGTVVDGEIRLSGDGFGGDDVWHFALPAQRQVKVRVVEHAGGASGRVRPSFFLSRALAAGGAATVEVIEDADCAQRPWDGCDAVFLTGGSRIPEAVWPVIRKVAESGGTVASFANQLDGTAPAAWPVEAGAETTLPPGRIATRVLTPDHPLFLGLWSEAQPFPPLSQGTARKATPRAGARVLATLAGELPLVVETRCGQGSLVWINTSADRAWGDLPLSPAFVPLMQQIARLGELSSRAPTQRWVGESWPTLSTPVRWMDAENHATATPGPAQAGRFTATRADGRTLWTCAANVRREESDLRPLNPDALQRFLPGRLATGETAMTASERDAHRQIPLWPWLLAAAAMIYVAESWWSLRAAERRLKSSATSNRPSTPGSGPHALREGRIPS